METADQRRQPFARSSLRARARTTLGAGIEYALIQNWSLKLEYDYVDLGTRQVTLAGAGGLNFVLTSGSSFILRRSVSTIASAQR
jgi:hypothetical protein